MSTSHTKVANEKKLKRGNTQEHYYLPFLKQTTGFQHKLLSKPITIVNTALFVLNFLNLPQGDSLIRAEKHF